MITIKTINDTKIQYEIHKRLRAYNRKKCKWIHDNEKEIPSNDERKYKNFIVYDDETLVGGAIGFIEYNWYFLDKLYVNENYRNKKIGKLLINNIEKYAIENTLVGVRVGTWDFQAINFYKKMGYTVFGELKDCPVGTIHYDLKKVFNYDS